MTATDPGPLIGRGRAADVFDLGNGRVLRRYRSDTEQVAARVEHEAAAMRHLHAAGYPVPVVHEASGPDMVMDRLTGRTMLQELAARPWRARWVARQLADLHRRLEQVPTDGLDLPHRLGAPECVVHLDLHPGNVMVTTDGCVVFDWANAGLGPRGADVATTWILLTIGEADDVPAPVRLVEGLIRRQLRSLLLAGAGRPSRDVVQAAGEIRLADPNLRDAERARLVQFLDAEGTGREPPQPASDM